MYNFLNINIGDNPNQGREKINYNFSLINSVITGSTTGITGNFLPLSGGTVTGDTFFSSNISGTTFFSGATNLYDIFSIHDYIIFIKNLN